MTAIPSNETEPRHYIISFGGSLLFDEQVIDLEFLRDMQTLLRTQVTAGNRFIVVVGGGNVSRQYQRALKSLGGVDLDLDWIGIHACRFNAQLVRLLLQDISHPEVLLNAKEYAGITSPIVFAGGFTPGWSSDYVSIELAEAAGIKKVINMTNTSYVYDKDPALYPDAKAFEDLTWDAFKELIPKEWSPGLHTPFDPHAAREAQRSGIEVAIIGKNVKNLQDLLEGKKYIGTKLHL